jgi:hypothetical protein
MRSSASRVATFITLVPLLLVACGGADDDDAITTASGSSQLEDATLDTGATETATPVIPHSELPELPGELASRMADEIGLGIVDARSAFAEAEVEAGDAMAVALAAVALSTDEASGPPTTYLTRRDPADDGYYDPVTLPLGGLAWIVDIPTNRVIQRGVAGEPAGAVLIDRIVVLVSAESGDVLGSIESGRGL